VPIFPRFPRAPGRTLARVLALLAVTLSFVVAPLAVVGCSRQVTFGPAGEPTGDHKPTWLRFTIAVDPAGLSAAQAFATGLAKVGVRAGVTAQDRGALTARALAGELDAVLLAFSVPTPHPLALYGKLAPDGVENYSGYANLELGRLLSGLVTRAATADREAAARAAQEFLHEDAPWLFGVSLPLYDAATAALSGWLAGPAGRVSLREARLADASGRVVVCLGLTKPPALDPFGPLDSQAGIIVESLFDSLAALGPDGNLVPELADTWEFSANARRLTVKLRDGVLFHNGATLSPQDVVFTYEKTLRGRLPGEVTVTTAAGEDGTVVFRFSAPFPSFLELFGQTPVVPSVYYELSGPEGFAASPVGTGPFRLEPGRSGRRLALVRWDGYYGGASAIAEVAFLFNPDPAKRVAMLRDGQAHLAPALTPAAAASLRGQPGLVVAREPGWTILAVEFNTRRPPFSDTRVRLALNLALDREALAVTLGPEATPLPSVFLPEGFGFSAAASGFAVDTGAAKALLREAGYLVGEDR
jgi:ABC-type transport system substrate-binding protein